MLRVDLLGVFSLAPVVSMGDCAMSVPTAGLWGVGTSHGLCAGGSRCCSVTVGLAGVVGNIRGSGSASGLDESSCGQVTSGSTGRLV